MDSRYEIVHASAGQGGFGRIDKAFDTALERPVAIKTLDPLFKSTPSEEDIERFMREAKALARLSHPSVPAIFDVQFAPEAMEFKIICEWIEGQTLRDYLQDRGVLSLEEARGYFTQICSALSHAHDHGLVHRDIKPTNIILDHGGAACYLVDFGIALNSDDYSRLTKGSPIGTAGYMSPEQERGENITAASDVFSLGVVLYESLAGSRPAVGGYKSLGLHNEAIPPGVDALVQQALADDPARRPQSAREFIDRLSASLRPHSSFTSTLADGSLHEIQLALNQMGPADFAALPPGQRVLVTTRLTDLATVDDERLRRAVATLLSELVRLAHVDAQGEYSKIVSYAFEYGYKKRYGESWQGDVLNRSALNEVALRCADRAHAIITASALELVEDAALIDRPGWYFHDLRILLQNLLINPVCAAEQAIAVGEALTRVNDVSH